MKAKPTRTPAISKKNIRRPYSSNPKPTGRPGKSLAKALLQYYGAAVSPEHFEPLWHYHRLLLKYKTDADLTRLHSFDSIFQKHYADCILAFMAYQSPLPSPLLDVGSGAGFPGIIFKILSPDTHIILAEPRPKRVEFLNHVIKALHLKNIKVFSHKVTRESFTQPINGCTSRAFASINKTMPLLTRCLSEKGRVIFLKGPAVQAELDDFSDKRFQISNIKHYNIPNTPQRRVLVTVIRNPVTPPK